ncbi:MAG: AAA family ATPase [bacterium]
MDAEKPILAICGKGGVGKTACCALLSRALLEAGVRPLLLIDADPVGGLASAIGERAVRTIAAVRERLIASARTADEAEKARLAIDLDYLVMEALLERDGYSLFAMGHNSEKGCYCPVNTLLRQAIDLVADPFSAVLIDAEAGIEQINRQVTRRVSRILVVTDGSTRSTDTLNVIAGMVGKVRVSVVANRSAAGAAERLPEGVDLAGAIPEDDELSRFDRAGRPLWELPPQNPALRAARGIARSLGFPAGS